jgi:hypothetical protein
MQTEMQELIQAAEPFANVDDMDITELEHLSEGSVQRLRNALFAARKASEGGWISVDQQIPPDRTEVLAFNALGHIVIDWRKGNEWAGDQPYEISHWRLLPSPPLSVEKPK